MQKEWEIDPTIPKNLLLLKHRMTKKQIELENERQETLESQLQLQQKNQVLGLPQNVFYGILALIGLIVVIVAIRK